MDQHFDIQAYMMKGVERVVADAIKATVKNPKESALNSSLFTALRSGDLLADDHRGGCVLYEKRSRVEALLDQKGRFGI